MPRPLRLSLALALVAACGDDVDPLDSVGPQPTAGPQTTKSTTDDPTSSGTTGDGMTATSSGTITVTDPSTSDATTTAVTGPMGDLSHADDIQPIWDQYCVIACHTEGGSAAAWFWLSQDVAYDAIVGQPSVSFPNLTLVTPGDKEASYLWHKLNGAQLDVGGGGSTMPLGSTLNGDDILKIGEWIDQGAAP